MNQEDTDKQRCGPSGRSLGAVAEFEKVTGTSLPTPEAMALAYLINKEFMEDGVRIDTLKGALDTAISCGDAQREKIKDLKMSVSRMRAWSTSALKEAADWMRCIYCNELYGPGRSEGEMAKLLVEHVEDCPDHPLAETKTKIKDLKKDRTNLIRALGSIIHKCKGDESELAKSVKKIARKTLEGDAYPIDKCHKCKKGKVEFDLPDFFCKECWADWWVDGLEPETEEEREQLKKETLENMGVVKDFIKENGDGP